MKNSTRPNKPELDATKVPTEIDIAWAAGIYEGEGHCRLCGHGKRSFAAAVVQKDPELLYRLRDWFGGSVNSNGAWCNVWDICGDRARVFIALIYKFMTARRKMQIDETNCLDFLGAISAEVLNEEVIRELLLKYYQDKKDRTLANPKVRSSKRQLAYYRRKIEDPAWKDKINARRREQRSYKKKQILLHVVKLNDTA